MDYRYNNPNLETNRRTLRRTMTAPETILWAKIRDRRLNGHKFKRQYSVGDYILDFYCPAKRLAIELDGDSHYEDDAQKSDEIRDKFLRSNNITVLRFTNDDVMKNLQGILEKIDKAIDTTSP